MERSTPVPQSPTPNNLVALAHRGAMINLTDIMEAFDVTKVNARKMAVACQLAGNGGAGLSIRTAEPDEHCELLLEAGMNLNAPLCKQRAPRKPAHVPAPAPVVKVAQMPRIRPQAPRRKKAPPRVGEKVPKKAAQEPQERPVWAGPRWPYDDSKATWRPLQPPKEALSGDQLVARYSWLQPMPGDCPKVAPVIEACVVRMVAFLQDLHHSDGGPVPTAYDWDRLYNGPNRKVAGLRKTKRP